MHRALPLALLASTGLWADGPADLKAALARLQGNTPVKGSVDVRTWTRSGEGKELTERTGQAGAWVEDGPQGLKMMWNRTLIAQVRDEARAKRKNPEAKTPTSSGLGNLTPRNVQDQINAAESVANSLEHAVFQAETREAWNGRPARLLTYKLTQNGMSAKERKYVKEFDGTAKVWIEEDGTPLAASTTLKVKGRAFMVVSFSQEREETFAFSKVGDRLVCTKEESAFSGSGAGEQQQGRTVTTFAIQ